jgi:type I site-specific restriction-modification system R (restriction) subunit
MATKVLTVEQLIARKKMRESGVPDDVINKQLQLSSKVKSLEKALQTKGDDADIEELKKEVDQNISAILAKHGVTPVDELIKIATEKDDKGQFTASRDQRIRIWQDMLQYTNSKLRSVEMHGMIKGDFRIQLVNYGAEGQILEEKPLVLDADVKVEKLRG